MFCYLDDSAYIISYDNLLFYFKLYIISNYYFLKFFIIIINIDKFI